MYRNPYMDDPRAKGLSRSTANTHVINHKGLILALKEDSPPVAMDLNTLETVDPVYTFDGQLPRDRAFTAHPKVCSKTGNIVAFGYEADGFGSASVAFFEIDKAGKKVWETKIPVPYCGLLHDFAVTENHIALFVVPLAFDPEQIKRGGIHWSWDKTLKSHLGWFRRYGDGKDVKWVQGPAQSGTHTMGAFEDAGRIHFDTEMTAGSPFPFMPNRTARHPPAGSARSTASAPTSGKTKGYEVSSCALQAPLKQDDRYNTCRRYGGGVPGSVAPGEVAGCYAHGCAEAHVWNPDRNCRWRAIRAQNVTPRGRGVSAVPTTRPELSWIAERVKDGPIARVKLPVQASPQVHGWWVREDQYPA
jgi:carotenoid cleavage dioxygenase